MEIQFVTFLGIGFVFTSIHLFYLLINYIMSTKVFKFNEKEMRTVVLIGKFYYYYLKKIKK